MKSEINTKLIIRLYLTINRIICVIFVFTVIVHLSACNSAIKEVKNESTVFTKQNENSALFESTSNAVLDEVVGMDIESSDIIISESDELISFLNNFDKRFHAYASFYDFNNDGHEELFYASHNGIGRSFDTVNYEIYTLQNKVPEFYGIIRLEITNCNSKLTEHTFCEGKLQRFFDSENKIYTIVGDETKWDDGSFGNLQYSVIKNTLYSDKIVNSLLEEVSGTSCIPAQYIRENDLSEYSYFDDGRFTYFNNIFDLNSTEKFVDVTDALKSLEFVDTIDLNSLQQYKDVNEIAKLISEYSVYENANVISAPDDENEYIGIVGMGDHKICTKDTAVSIGINDIDELDWNKICEIEDLHSFVLNYFGEDEINIDLSPLKKYSSLTSISLWGNISENTKRQISEFQNLEYVNKWDILISSEEDFEYVKDLPKLRYIAVASDNDDPDHFKFLYDNKSIKWIRFDNSVTKEQIKQVVNNMLELEAVTLGFSEV